MPDIFISYERSDRPHAERIASVLEKRGWSVWWDRKILAGETFSQTIEKTIEEARCVVVLWSASSVASSWVRDEATEGTQRNILVPVLIDEIEMPLGFRQLHAVAIGDPATEENPSKFDDLVAAVDRVLSRSAVAAAPGQPREAASTPASREQNTGGSEGTVPRSYLYAALGVAAILAALVVWGRFGVDTLPIGGSNSGSGGSSAGSPAVGGTTQATGAARTPDPAAAAPSAPAEVAPLSSAEVSDSPAEAAGIVVSGKGNDFYTVFDSAGVKQLGYAKTEAPIELFPGDYVVALHGVRRSVTVAPRRRTNLPTGTIPYPVLAPISMRSTRLRARRSLVTRRRTACSSCFRVTTRSYCMA